MSETQGTALLGAVPGYHRHHALFQVAVGKKGLQIEMTVPAGPMWLRSPGGVSNETGSQDPNNGAIAKKISIIQVSVCRSV